LYYFRKGNNRTEEEREKLAGKKKDHLGYKHKKPLIDLPLEYFIIDPLHQFIRISGKLIVLLCDNLKINDGLLDNMIFKKEKHSNMKKFLDFLINECKLKCCFEGKKGSEISELLKGLTGPAKEKIFDKIDILMGIFDNLDDGDGHLIINDVSKIWKSYWKFHKMIREKDKTYEKEEISEILGTFMDDFLRVYCDADLIPYIHITCLHFAEQYEIVNGKMCFFTCEGLEKLNDNTTSQFFQSTNKHEQFTKQILERDQRILNGLRCIVSEN